MENCETPKFVISGTLLGQHDAHVCMQDAVQSVCRQTTSAHPLPPLQHHHEQQAQQVDLRVVFFPFKYTAYKHLLKVKEGCFIFSSVDQSNQIFSSTTPPPAQHHSFFRNPSFSYPNEVYKSALQTLAGK